jgi:hypothetical protein
MGRRARTVYHPSHNTGAPAPSNFDKRQIQRSRLLSVRAVVEGFALVVNGTVPKAQSRIVGLIQASVMLSLPFIGGRG